MSIEDGAIHPDTLNLVQCSLAAANEIRTVCIEEFPALAPKINESYNSWPLAKTKIEIRVNGVDYFGTAIEFARKTTRQNWMSMPAERRLKGCEDYQRVLQDFVSSIPDAERRVYIVQ